MKSSHPKALQAFARNLHLLLAMRLGVQLITVWFFIWGVVTLALRILGAQNTLWLTFGLLAAVPLALLAVWLARKQQASFTRIRASYDQVNACGGIMMSGETGDMAAWLAQMSHPAVPKLHWHNGRALSLLCLSTLFVATALLLPARLTHFSTRLPLEIGQMVEQLQAEVKTLEQEKILEDKPAQELQKQLSQLQKNASGFDPGKTWEALDHIKEADANAAKQAAEEAIAKTSTLAESESITQAMMKAAESGMTEATASQAAQDLASLLKSAKLEDGVLNAKIPPELLAGLNGLNGLDQEKLQKLLDALQFSKNSLGKTMTNLAQLKMIDAATLSKCKNAGTGKNPKALADYLSTCTNGFNLMAECDRLGQGGPGGGGPEAPMTWTDGASEKDLKFQEHPLAPATHLSDAQLVGVSRAAPELSDNTVATQHGALDDSQASGGSAHARVILPEHKQAVQNFFKRDQ